MRICVVTQEYPPGYVGGIGTQSLVKAHGLAALGHEVAVLTAGEDSGPALVSRDDGVMRVHEVRTPGGRFPVYRPETYWLGYTWAVLGALRSLSADRPFDVIDFPDYSAEGLAFQLDRQDDESTAVVVHLHGSLRMFAEQIGWPEPGDPLHTIGTFMEDQSILAADRLLAASASIARFTSASAGIPLEQIDVVEGAVDLETFSPAPERAARAAAVLLFVGNVVANKGVLTVFEAFTRIAPAHLGLSLVVAGEQDPEIAEELRARAGAAGLEERFKLLGFVEQEQLPALYGSADLLAAPSQYEGGLGMVYLEAMASGLPVIARAAGGAAEAIVDGETGVLLARGDVDEVTVAIERLLRDPALRARIGSAARRRAEERFGPQRYAARVVTAYERAIEQRRAGVLSL